MRTSSNRRRRARPAGAGAQGGAAGPAGAAHPAGAALLAIAAALLFAAPTHLRGQEAPADDSAEAQPAGTESGAQAAGSRWFPASSPMPPLIAAPREPSLRGVVIRTERDHSRAGANLPDDPGEDPFVLGDFQGANLEAEAALGHRLPILHLRRGETARGGRGPVVALEFGAAVVSRFFLETRQNDLINSDYRVGFPISASWRDWQALLEPRHISSHVGDDFAERFGVADREVSLDGFELLLGRRVGSGFRAYAGGEWNLRTARGMETLAGRAGLEYDPGVGEPGRGSWPFAAIDLRLNDEARRAEISIAAGLAVRFRGVGLRFEATGHRGPSPMGWLRSADETYWGLGLRLAPGGL